MVKQERAGRTRQAVLLAAARTFADAGYESASLVDISRCAGVSKGALYFHFVSKQALAEGVRAAARRVIATAVLRARRSDGPAVQALLDLAHELARLLREDIVVRAGVLLSQGTQSGKEPPGPGAPEGCGPWRDWTVMVRRQLVLAEASGELRPGAGPQESAELLTAVAAGLVLLSWADAAVLRPEAVAAVLASALPALVPAGRTGEYRTEGSGAVFPRADGPAPVAGGCAGPGPERAAHPAPERAAVPGPAWVFDLGRGFVPAPARVPAPVYEPGFEPGSEPGFEPGFETCSAASG
ncbi:hypothetical protein GCM10018781_59580 [Kitasatospora indigofera]|uniref:HTH tetR-type domain-containing protein n=1 Tax=Kitasatospora indigofera TaxID=67307 RepID=A0A919G8P1_9ACTN|nr:ScbR family autoregulator-binding transcription factor [Kitasatospora indigofera]GHH80090.1 hypothetical protein GCM10018781_59580 [Kitasatospora indigofera]